MKAIIISIIFSVMATVTVYHQKYEKLQEQLSSVQQELEKANLIISQQAHDIIKANTAINTQNMALETLKIALKKKETEAQQSYQSLNELYQKELDKSNVALKEDNSCEHQLQIIQNAWQEFIFQ